MDSNNLSKAINEVFEELRALSEEEFKKELAAHENGDICQILLETDALRAVEREAESSYEEYTNPPFDEVASSLIDINYDQWTASHIGISSHALNLFEHCESISWAHSTLNQAANMWNFTTMPLIETVQNQLSFINEMTTIVDLSDIYSSPINIDHLYKSTPIMNQKTIEVTLQNPINNILINDESELEWAA